MLYDVESSDGAAVAGPVVSLDEKYEDSIVGSIVISSVDNDVGACVTRKGVGARVGAADGATVISSITRWERNVSIGM